jgi:hypothetical protein
MPVEQGQELHPLFTVVISGLVQLLQISEEALHLSECKDSSNDVTPAFKAAQGRYIIAACLPVPISEITFASSDFPVPCCGASIRASGTQPEMTGRTIGVNNSANALAPLVFPTKGKSSKTSRASAAAALIS